ncbi:MAG: paraquat-inducible protein A [Moritella dasanensis]|jgi:paraquat-inducible protein A
MSNINVCNKCDLIVDHVPIAKNRHAHCPRCNTLLYKNNDFSISSILALSITGLILVVIANVFPMFTITMLGVEEAATLIQGAWTLFDKKFYFVGLLVIFCSFVAPFLFLSCLTQACLLLLTKRNTPQLILLLKLVKFFTEWSMLEVYLVSFLIAVFKLSDIADIKLQFGLLSFVSLMFVSSLIMYRLNLETFWQKMEKNAKR